MGKVTINGHVYSVGPDDVVFVIGGKVYFNHQVVHTGQQSICEVKVEGDLLNMYSVGAVRVSGDVKGAVDTVGPVDVAGSVGGDVNTTGPVDVGGECGNIDTTGPVTVRGSCKGNIDTMGRVTVGGR